LKAFHDERDKIIYSEYTLQTEQKKLKDEFDGKTILRNQYEIQILKLKISFFYLNKSYSKENK